jgi:hypothetical protein
LIVAIALAVLGPSSCDSTSKSTSSSWDGACVPAWRLASWRAALRRQRPEVLENPLQIMMRQMGFWGWLVFLVVAIGGIIVQWRSTATYTVVAYEDRM